MMKLTLARTLASAVLVLAVGAPASAQYFNNKNNDESYKGNNNYNRYDSRYKGNDDNYAGSSYTGDTNHGEHFTVPGPGTLALLGIGVAGLGIGVAGLVVGLRRKK